MINEIRNDYNKNKIIELGNLIRDNQELQVLARINSEVVGSDEYHYWFGIVCSSKITDIAVVELYGENKVFERDEADEILEYMLDGYSESEANEMYKKIEWKKCILIYVEP